MNPDTDIPAPLVQTMPAVGAPRSTSSLEEWVMNAVSTVTSLVVGGFAIYRASTGDTHGAAINTFIVMIVIAALLLGRSKRFAQFSLNLFGATISAGCLISSLLVSSNGLLWALLVVLINAVTLGLRWALGLNAIVIIVLGASLNLYQSPVHQVSWITVAVLINTFAVMMMIQLRDQRHKLMQQANLDPLTGAGNRRLMRQHLKDIVAERRSGQRNATLMVLDLDHFKRVNDQHGHETGDRVLIEVAQSIAGSLRADDGIYRMGGEEFVILLRTMDDTTASSYLPDLHARLSGSVKTPDGQVFFSAGAAGLRGDEDWSQWLARADRALYNAKSDGRNQLCFSGE